MAQVESIGGAAASADFIAGTGDMSALMRSHDWSTTALGRVEGWPQSLQTAVSIMLASRFPMLLLWGPDYIQLYNDAIRPILGATKHPAALGQRARDCWSEIWDVLDPMFRGVMDGGEAIWNEDLQFILDRNGYLEETFFTFSYSAIRDESGRPGGILVTCVETTERVVNERRLQTLRELAAHAATAQRVDETYQLAAGILSRNPHDLPFVMLYAASGTTATLCAAAGIERGTAASPEQVALSDSRCPWPLAQVISEAAPRLVLDTPSTVGPLPGGPWPEAATGALVLPMTPVPGKATGALVAGISPRRALDAGYRSFLELVAGQLSTAIGAARSHEAERERAEALAEIDRAKTAFFANISHEFRTPLTLMIGPLEAALAESGDVAANRDRLELAHRNSLRLLKLVNTLLEFSRIEAGRSEAVFEPTDLGALSAELASNFRSSVERAGMTLSVDCPALPEPVYVDRRMWETVVLNLLSNAFKFTFEGGITVVLRQADGSVQLTVSDTGIGIPRGELPRLFDRFHRVKGARGRSYEGSGIGLALVQELVKLHGGQVRVESEVGRGTVFTVAIPLGTAHLPPDRLGAVGARVSSAGQAAAFVQEAEHWLPDQERSGGAPHGRPSTHLADEHAGAVPPRGAGQRVLVVDDNADMRQYLRGLLAGYDVETVPDGATALKAANEGTPDLVLTDVMLPGIDGFELLRELRADPAMRDVPVILLSARAGDEARIAGMKAGADDYLTKPFSARELLARVDAHVRLAALRRDSQRALRDSEERYRQLTGLLPVAVYTCEAPSGVITFYNQQAARLWGRAPRTGDTDERFCGSFRLWRTDGTPLPHDETPMALALREGRSFRNEDVIVERPDGSRISVLVNIDPITDADGRIRGAINAFHDTTALRAAQEQLRRSEEHLRAVVDTTPACIKVVAADGTLVHMNPSGLAMVDAARPEEVEGKAVIDLISEEHRSAFRAFHDRVCRGERGTLEFDVVSLRGRRRHMETYAAPLRAPDGSIQQLAITHDVTERKAVEDAVRRAVEELRIVTDAMAVPVTRCTKDLRYAWVSRPYGEWIGRSAEDIVGRPIVDVIGEEAFEHLAPMFTRVLDGEVVRYEEQVAFKGIGLRWVNAIYTPTVDASGRYDGWVAVVLDITERRRAEDTHRHLAAIVESSDDAIVGADVDGVVTSWNSGAERLYGYTSAEMLGTPVSALMPADHQDDFDVIMRRLSREERIEHYETVRVARDGRRIDVSLTISPIRDAGGRIVGVSKIARDISERKRTEAAVRTHAERSRLLSEASAVLLSTHEPDAMLTQLFAKIGASLGLDVYLNYMVAEGGAELRLMSCAGISGDEASTIARLQFGQAVCGTVALRRTPIVAQRIQQSDDPMVQLVRSLGIRAYACAPLMAGQRLLGTLSFASRTRDDFDQDEIAFLQTISQYVAAAYERVRLIDQLRDQDRRKDEFLAMLAHELRNPLAPIRTGVQLIQRAGASPALMDKACSIMERQLLHLVRLVDDLLDVSRVTRNKLELRKEWVDLATIIQSAVETSRPLIEAAGHELTVSLPVEPVVLDADGVRLAQAFANFLNNAAKYTQRGGRIWITAESPDAGHGTAADVIVRVRDTGIGIAPDHLPHIFDLFVQVERSLERTQGGLGIGLTLAKRLIEMHGGTVSAFSEGLGKGSEFVARLPIVVIPEPAKVDAGARAAMSDRPRARRRILVVDDNRDSADLLAAMLRLSGHEVETAHDGLEAVEKADRLQPDVVLMDLGMPRLNGYEAARRMRQQPNGKRMTLVAVTGWGHDDDKQRSRESGFNAHLVKPVDVAAFDRLLDRLANDRRASDE